MVVMFDQKKWKEEPSFLMGIRLWIVNKCREGFSLDETDINM